VILVKYPKLEQVKEELLEAGAVGAVMTGTGSTVLGLFEPERKIEWRGRGRVLKIKGVKKDVEA
jgi:4-diphosphocytidyl-2-C-methyl-D-erythritol kinase